MVEPPAAKGQSGVRKPEVLKKPAQSKAEESAANPGPPGAVQPEAVTDPVVHRVALVGQDEVWLTKTFRQSGKYHHAGCKWVSESEGGRAVQMCEVCAYRASPMEILVKPWEVRPGKYHLEKQCNDMSVVFPRVLEPCEQCRKLWGPGPVCG